MGGISRARGFTAVKLVQKSRVVNESYRTLVQTRRTYNPEVNPNAVPLLWATETGSTQVHREGCVCWGVHGKPLHLPLKFKKTAQKGQKNQNPIFTTVNPACLPPEGSPPRRPSVYKGAPEASAVWGENTGLPCPQDGLGGGPALPGALPVSSSATILDMAFAHTLCRPPPHQHCLPCLAARPSCLTSPAYPPVPQPSRCPDIHLGGPAHSVPPPLIPGDVSTHPQPRLEACDQTTDAPSYLGPRPGRFSETHSPPRGQGVAGYTAHPCPLPARPLPRHSGPTR